MQDETANPEPNANESNGESEELLLHRPSTGQLLGTFAAAYIATFIIVYILIRMWDEDTIRLRMLDLMIRVLQTIARICGGWALTCEKAYNDYANSLH